MSSWFGDELQLSSSLGADYVVTVSTPYGYERKQRSYPLVLALDAHWLYGTVRDLALSMSIGRLIPRVVVAGLGWPSDDLVEITRLRQRDTTPTSVPFPGEPPTGHDGPGTGGAVAFGAFILDELLPTLRRRYRLNNSAMLVGHSLTGLFGVHSLLRRPEGFESYLLTSPSLWWDDVVTLRVTEPEVAASRTDLSARVYLSAGAAEGTDPRSAPFRMVGNVEELARRLRQYDGLEMHLEILPGETHHSTLGQSVSRGLRALLGFEPVAGL